ncbi:hypothetical protein [uncultured Cardiobacterium sp.]|uniref:hypothetical protein n=1 Tax=uncultured Cardiobacterium sp. TaxID=417619 RepID=UPI00262E0CA6|nr:hypothetical protein [uncultured Cardiobacterium sp.]
MKTENPYPRKSVRRNFTMCGTLFGFIPALFLSVFPVVGPILFLLTFIFLFPLAWIAGAFIASLELRRTPGGYLTAMTICAFLGLSCLFPFSRINIGTIGGPMFGSAEEAVYIILTLIGIGAFSGLMTALMTLPGKENHSENEESP